MKNLKQSSSSPFFEPISGFEPETPSLRVKCSTAELNRQRNSSFRNRKYRKIFANCTIFAKKIVFSHLVKPKQIGYGNLSSMFGATCICLFQLW